MNQYQHIACVIVFILYLFSASWQTRWLYFKLNITSDVLDNIEDYLWAAGHSRAERRSFRAGWIKDKNLRREFARKVIS